MTQPPRRDRSVDDAALRVKAALVKESLEDSEFRRLVLRDPVAAVRRSRFIADADRVLAAGFEVTAAEETAELLYLVVPAVGGRQPTDPDNPKDVLLAKALTDEDFLRRLMTDPRSAIESELLVEIPAGLEVKVLRETARHRILVLPVDLRSGQRIGVPDELMEYQAAIWGDCDKTLAGTSFWNFCAPKPGDPPYGPADTIVQGPTCPSQPL